MCLLSRIDVELTARGDGPAIAVIVIMAMCALFVAWGVLTMGDDD